ncbi:hypothetical protein [Methanimicrococcus blatticola]|uniref:Uncharacterized protein n=1 Tax=Methanimicrococcus blatticola TaxID=91560 RepID=A0A484F757_9EURY|nr:hypothetical protein [Methanimicrococcus blatticola]MBZ3936284.1 hypothetical protein [Methanimicrococcus blatticola]MCC2508287.1 hypothetical protein [Methanimicrococcus blatticola]TDQ70258.1 hypothetical protein C7391_0600 [Methanimicrococcus blatticola]
MNLKILLHIGIISILLFASIGNAAGSNPTYVHVLHNYDGTVIGTTENPICDENDKYEYNVDPNLKGKIQTKYNNKDYEVEKIEIQYEVANLKVDIVNKINAMEETKTHTETVKMNSTTFSFYEYPKITKYDKITTLYEHYISLDTSNAKQDYEPAVGYVPMTREMSVKFIYTTVTYPLVGEITYTAGKGPDPNTPIKLSNEDPKYLYGTETPYPLEEGSHYVMTITYKEKTSTPPGENPKPVKPEPAPEPKTEPKPPTTPQPEPELDVEPFTEPIAEKHANWIFPISILFLVVIGALLYVRARRRMKEV